LGGSADKLLAEIMGREEEVCGGYGGSQHLKEDNFLLNRNPRGRHSNGLRDRLGGKAQRGKGHRNDLLWRRNPIRIVEHGRSLELPRFIPSRQQSLRANDSYKSGSVGVG